MLEELCKRIQHCCATLWRSRNKRDVGNWWLKSLTGFKLCEQHATTYNNIQQGVQTDAICNIQQCWGHARSLRMDYKDLLVVFFPRCTAGPKLVGRSCCIRLHTTANTHATTGNNVGSCCARLHAALRMVEWSLFLSVEAVRTVGLAKTTKFIVFPCYYVQWGYRCCLE